MTVQEIGRAIKADVATILEGWPSLSDKDTWLQLPRGLDIDHVPDMLRSLADAALLEPDSEAARQRLVLTAAQHGAHRRDQGFPEHLLFLEHDLARRAVARHIQRLTGGSAAGYEALARLDIAITLASTAALHGYHRLELEEQGRWPEAIEQLAHEWEPPWQEG